MVKTAIAIHIAAFSKEEYNFGSSDFSASANCASISWAETISVTA
jgi:hypothetical protein